jgi:hypothetical protein
MQTNTEAVWTSLRARLRGAREAHAARTRLRSELASYTSPQDLNDLDAILDRYSDRETTQIRQILAGQRGQAFERDGGPLVPAG